MNDERLIRTSTEAQTARNKEVVERFIRDVAIGGQLDLLDVLVAEDYIQHNPHAAQGRAGLRQFIETFDLRGLEPEGRIATNLIGEGEFVVYQEIRANGMLIDIWRVRGGMLHEHWDAWRTNPGHEPVPGF